jgi:hypothetical protein
MYASLVGTPKRIITLYREIANVEFLIIITVTHNVDQMTCIMIMYIDNIKFKYFS